MRQVIEWATRVAWLRDLSARYADRRFKRWQRRNPEGDFAQFYADDVLAKISRGQGHPTLGSKGFKAGQNRSIEWDRAAFAERGASQWAYYAKVTGVGAGKRCVDFGCGSIRVGQHAIRELGPGDYWGLDVTDSFFEAGRKLLDPALVAAKAPKFSVISDQTLESVRQWQPHALFANAVLQHVPREELPTFFQRVARVLAPGAIAAIVFISEPSITRVKAMSWAYPDEVLLESLREADDELEAEFLPIDGDDAQAFNGRRRLLRIRRPAEA